MYRKEAVLSVLIFKSFFKKYPKRSNLHVEHKNDVYGSHEKARWARSLSRENIALDTLDIMN